MKKIGFIGCGKMASAIIEGAKGKYCICASEVNSDFAQKAEKRLGIKVIYDNKELVKNSDIIFIATKPNQVSYILEEIKNVITQETLIISIAAGVTTQKIENILGEGIRIIRIMPNTPALVKLGMFGICKGKYSTEEDEKFAEEFLSAIGKSISVTEEQMDIVTAISGSGPAFFYQVIEDMARAGEKLGLEYEKSLILATQTALGSAQMIFNRGKTNVQTLIDNVATKGGCTFVGIEEMKNKKTSDLFYDVIKKTTDKARSLG